MHTHQGAAVPAQPNHNSDQAIQDLRAALAPHWAPLEKLCPPGLCEQFMYMGVVDGIYLYKHVDSRRYLNLDVHGDPYAYSPTSSRYYPITVAAARIALAEMVDSQPSITPSHPEHIKAMAEIADPLAVEAVRKSTSVQGLFTPSEFAALIALVATAKVRP